MSEPLKKVGNYRLLKSIGRGATAEVFEAKKEGSSELFAVKMIRLKGLDITQREIITKEVDIIKKIEHPNIVKLS